MQNYILYRTEDGVDSINECRYSLLKLLALYNLQGPKNLHVIIYTRHPGSLEAYSSFFHHFELVDKQAEKGSKIALVQEFLTGKNGNVLYMDNDTYPLKTPDALFNKLEGKENFLFFGKKDSPKKLKEYIGANHLVYDGREINILDEKELYTAEVFGCSNECLPVLDKAVLLEAQMKDGISPKLAEAFTLTFATKDHERGIAENEIVSYRRFPEFKKLLQLFFLKNEEESIPNLVKLVHHLDAKRIEKEKMTYESLPFFKKLLHSVTGKAWSVRRYQNKF
jgi:hypothetical protein